MIQDGLNAVVKKGIINGQLEGDGTEGGGSGDSVSIVEERDINFAPVVAEMKCPEVDKGGDIDRPETGIRGSQDVQIRDELSWKFNDWHSRSPVSNVENPKVLEGWSGRDRILRTRGMEEGVDA